MSFSVFNALSAFVALAFLREFFAVIAVCFDRYRFSARFLSIAANEIVADDEKGMHVFLNFVNAVSYGFPTAILTTIVAFKIYTWVKITTSVLSCIFSFGKLIALLHSCKGNTLTHCLEPCMRCTECAGTCTQLVCDDCGRMLHCVLGVCCESCARKDRKGYHSVN